MKTLLTLCVHLVLSGVVFAQAPTGELKLKAQNWTLKAENYSLKVEALRKQAEEQGQLLQAERAELEKELRAELKPSADFVFNWQTLTFEAPPPPKTSGQ